MKATMRRLSMSPTTDNETRSFVTDGRAVGPQNMTFIQEPNLRFRYDQALEDPRDGLRLFGPLDHGRPYGIRAGVVGTAVGIEYFRDWTRRIQAPLSDTGSQIARPPFPGFETVFGIPWAPEPRLTLEISAADLRAAVFLDDSYQRVFETVAVFTNPIVSALLREESDVDVWFVVIPDVVYENCRPRSRVSADQQVHVTRRLNPRSARRLKGWPSLFEEENRTAVAYHYDVDFRNQLKARLLDRLVSTQIIRESTIAPIGSTPGEPRPKRDVSKYQAAIAWNMCTAAFYKAGGRPWKMDAIRDGVCYVGLVFKQDEKHDDPRAACCAAQMFLDSGDGLVFRGAVGPWHTPGRSEFHLSRDAAKDLARLAVESYKTYSKAAAPPRELFIHGKVLFSDDEWRGFEEAVDTTRTNLVGIRIRDENDFRVFRLGSHPVIRGLAYARHERSAYLWTRGYTPRLQTYVGREVPRPLRVDVVRGAAPLDVVLSDIMALTKLNYNACMFGDGLPVTLRFADAVGEILTAGPIGTNSPLPFKHYI